MGNDMEIKDEKSYIFDKTMKCNVCNKEFTTKQVVRSMILLCVLIVAMRQFRELMES